MRLPRGILLSVLCTGVALAGSSLARAQDAATSGTVQEQPQPIEPTPIPSPPAKRTSKPTLEISAETPSQKPAPVAAPTPRAEELATLAATAEKETPLKRRATPALQPSAAESPVAGPMSISAAKALAVSAPLPEYPYQARRGNLTG